MARARIGTGCPAEGKAAPGRQDTATHRSPSGWVGHPHPQNRTFAPRSRVRHSPAEQSNDQMTERIPLLVDTDPGVDDALEIGRASCRERVCQYVYHSGVAVNLKKKTK